MSPIHSENKKHGGGFDLYGGVFNSKLFGYGKFDRSNAATKKVSKDDEKNAEDKKIVEKKSFEFHGNEKKSFDVNVNKEDRRSFEIFGNKDEKISLKILAKKEEKELEGKKSMENTKKDNVGGQLNSQMSMSDFSSSDNSYRSSPLSESSGLVRKSSDASSCSSCTSGSAKGTSPQRAMLPPPPVNIPRHYSGEVSSGTSSNAASPTTTTANSKDRKDTNFGRCRSVSSALGSPFYKPKCVMSPVAGIDATGRSKSGGLDCPPLIRSGSASSANSELNRSGSGHGRGMYTTHSPVTPIGNILPNGSKMMSPKGQPPHPSRPNSNHVFGSSHVHYGHGSIMRGNSNGNIKMASENMILKRALMSTNPDEVKNAGNEQYKRGNFSEALLLYERAIALSPGHPLYHSNKSAALTGLGRLSDAVQECEEAIKLDPGYSRAHQRLASLYLMLGEIDSAKKHCKLSGQPSDLDDIQRLQKIEQHLNNCTNARQMRDWKTLLKESNAAIMAGSDCALQFFACKAEALLKLQRLNEADAVLIVAPKTEFTSATKIFGIKAVSYVNFVQAQVDMSLGRFENAVTNAEKAVRLDPYSHEVSILLRHARAVCQARLTGNELFKAGRFSEACIAYGEGLDRDPKNAILLCNRAACRSKLGQWEKAVEDSNAALSIQPNYTKALLRRADSNAKLERWDESLSDYEILRIEMPGDVEVAKAMYEVQVAMKKSRGEETHVMSFGGEVLVISSTDQFRRTISAPGLAVVHFTKKSTEKSNQITPFLHQLCKRYPSVSFLQVDVEENLYLAKIESVNATPTFKIYKNGVKVKEIIGPSLQVLEYSVKQHSL